MSHEPEVALKLRNKDQNIKLRAGYLRGMVLDRATLFYKVTGRIMAKAVVGLDWTVELSFE